MFAAEIIGLLIAQRLFSPNWSILERTVLRDIRIPVCRRDTVIGFRRCIVFRSRSWRGEVILGHPEQCLLPNESVSLYIAHIRLISALCKANRAVLFAISNSFVLDILQKKKLKMF